MNMKTFARIDPFIAQSSIPRHLLKVSSLYTVQVESLLHDVPVAVLGQHHHHSAILWDVFDARSLEHELRGWGFAEELPVMEDHSVRIVTKLNDTKATVGLDVQSVRQEDI